MEVPEHSRRESGYRGIHLHPFTSIDFNQVKAASTHSQPSSVDPASQVIPHPITSLCRHIPADPPLPRARELDEVFVIDQGRERIKFPISHRRRIHHTRLPGTYQFCLEEFDGA